MNTPANGIVEEPQDADLLPPIFEDDAKIPTDWTPRRKVRWALYVLGGLIVAKLGLDVDPGLIGTAAAVGAAYIVRDN